MADKLEEDMWYVQKQLGINIWNAWGTFHKSKRSQYKIFFKSQYKNAKSIRIGNSQKEKPEWQVSIKEMLNPTRNQSGNIKSVTRPIATNMLVYDFKTSSPGKKKS